MESGVRIVTCVLILGVVFVNGWTDAPNAIVSAVCSRTLPYLRAVTLAAVCNLLGLFAGWWWGFVVGDSMLGMVDLSGAGALLSGGAVCAGMGAVILFAVGAWRLGIPTSESHALIAGLTGAALGLGQLGGVDLQQWQKVLYGLGLSLGLGVGTGYLAQKLLGGRLEGMSGFWRRKCQVLSAALLAFCHGLQDGQKFIAVFALLFGVGNGMGLPHNPQLLPLAVVVGGVMSLGTLAGGRRIIQNVGETMVQISGGAGISSDLAAILCIGLASATGLPVSTTHTKTMAVAGAGAAQRRVLSLPCIRQMVAAWTLTFPVCMLLGYLLTVGWRMVLAVGWG